MSDKDELNLDDAPFNTHAEQRRMVYEFRKLKEKNKDYLDLIKVMLCQIKEYSDNELICGNGYVYNVSDIERL